MLLPTLPPARLGSLAVFALGLGACLQADQSLPFDVDASVPTARGIGPEGGVLSLASGLSLIIPPGALAASTQIGATLRAGSFSSAAGSVVPGTAYDLTPAGVTFKVPARLQLRLLNPGLGVADLVRLGVAREVAGAATLVEGGSFDITSGILTADLTGLGGVAAVVSDDAIPLEPGTPPVLQGGTLGSGPAGASASGLGPGPGPGRASAAARRFAASCAPSARRCFSSGLVQLWISENLRARLGEDLALLTPSLSADLTFDAFDASGQPTEATGSVSIQGNLRARVGQAIANYRVDESFHTGEVGGGTTATSVKVQGNTLVLGRTSDGPSRTLEFGLRRVGTGEMLVLRMEQEVDLENDDGSTTTGTVILHVRLRR